MHENTRYDYLVVGSGPGGATVARELARAGENVGILEYGPRVRRTGCYHVGRRFFLQRDRRALKSEEGIFVGRMRVLGGSSFFSMACAVPPPPGMIEGWGLNLTREIQWANKELKAGPVPKEFIGPGSTRIIQSARSLGWGMQPTPKCIDFSKCKNCGQCMFGCPTGAKWSARDFVDEAVAHGAKLHLNTEVREVCHTNGTVTGVKAAHKRKPIRFEADKVIVAAGALGTPGILRNSGIDNAGKGLALDVLQTTYGYTRDIGMQKEIVMAAFMDGLMDQGLFPAPYMYNPLFLVRDVRGAFPERMGMVNMAAAWIKARRIKADRLLGIMTKIRDETNGEVLPDGTIRKELTPHDRRLLDKAHDINAKVLVETGADPDTIFRGMYEGGHPCCTTAIGKVVDTNLQTDIRNLFVSDAGVFAEPLGLPPILTIVALSKRLSAYLLSA